MQEAWCPQASSRTIAEVLAGARVRARHELTVDERLESSVHSARELDAVDDGVEVLAAVRGDFNPTRAVMNAADARHHHPAVGARHHSGINAFIDVRTRATFAVPARARRAYPYLRLA